MVRSGLTAALLWLAVSAPAFAHHRADHAGGPPSTRPTHAVPEIDASAGLLALGAVALLLLLVWERRRRVSRDDQKPQAPK